MVVVTVIRLTVALRVNCYILLKMFSCSKKEFVASCYRCLCMIMHVLPSQIVKRIKSVYFKQVLLITSCTQLIQNYYVFRNTRTNFFLPNEKKNHRCFISLLTN